MEPDGLPALAQAGQAEADRFNQQGNALMGEGRFQEAIKLYRQALECQPGMARAMSNMGVAYVQLGDMERALEWFRKAYHADPSRPASLQNLARTLCTLGREKELVHDNPDDPDLWCLLAVSLKELSYYDRAVECLDQAETLMYRRKGRADPAILINRVLILARQGKSEALAIAEQARWQFPKDDNILAAYGEALVCADRLEDAVSVFEDLIDRDIPVDPQMHLSYAESLFLLNRRDQAIGIYEKLIVNYPDLLLARFRLSMKLLAVGRYREGWADYEFRFIKLIDCGAGRYPAKPVWMGEPPTALDGPLLVISEQGYGDTLQFGRYVPLLVEQGYEVIFEVRPAIKRLFEESMPHPNLRFISTIDEPGRIYMDLPFAAYVSVVSLPHRFGTTIETIPDKPYLAASPVRKDYWQKRLFQSFAGQEISSLFPLKVGLVWAGDARPHDTSANLTDRRRSTLLEYYTELAEISGITWVNLQKGPPAKQIAGSWAEQVMLDFMEEADDFAETAAIIANLDLVISVDTSVVHLTGGMGVPVWVLSRFDGCWRWLLDREDSPWYPSARIFRQKKPGDWATVIGEVGVALRELVDNRADESNSKSFAR